MDEMTYEDYLELTAPQTPAYEWDETNDPGYDPGPMAVDKGPARLAWRTGKDDFLEAIEGLHIYNNSVAQAAAQVAQALVTYWHPDGVMMQSFIPHLHVAHAYVGTGHKVRSPDDARDESFAGVWEVRKEIIKDFDAVAEGLGFKGYGNAFRHALDLFDIANSRQSDTWEVYEALHEAKSIWDAKCIYLERCSPKDKTWGYLENSPPLVPYFSAHKFRTTAERVLLLAVGESAACKILLSIMKERRIPS